MNRRAFLQRAGALALAGQAAGCLGGSTAASTVTARKPTLRDLAAATRGPVLARGVPGYAQARLLYNERYDAVHPRAVLQAADAGDVQAALRWAASSGVRPLARSGGHSYAGFSTGGGALVIDLAALNHVHVTPDRTHAQIGAGARLIDVYAAVTARGRDLPSGSCPGVGFAGIAQAGGLGLLARAYGTTADAVESLRIVTADGRHLTADDRSNADLFWACRGGGGGNFGVVTDLTVRLQPALQASTFFASWPWQQAAAVVAVWQQLAPHAPDQLYAICALSTAASQPTVRVFGQYLGDEAALPDLLAPLRAVPGMQLQTGSVSPMQAHMVWAGCSGDSLAACHTVGTAGGATLPRAAFAAKSDYVVAPLPAAAIAGLVSAVEDRQRDPEGGTGALLLDPYGGAVNRVSADATAFVHRDALFAIQYLAYWTGPGGRSAATSWLDSAWTPMRPHVSGQAYVGYADPALDGWADAYYGANLPRLREVKRRYDPHGLFRFAQGVTA
jgi:FAD/FMN-containing dehydrogenase